MNQEIESLLKLLDDEQGLVSLCIVEFATDEEKARIRDADSDGHGESYRQMWWVNHAAALAFRLRDECVRDCPFRWATAILKGRHAARMADINCYVDGWINEAQPKHYIVASLIAKALKEQG